MEKNVILLVEDNPDDEMLTLRALKKNNIMNTVVVAHDGAEALDYLFGSGQFAGKCGPRINRAEAQLDENRAENHEPSVHYLLFTHSLPPIG